MFEKPFATALVAFLDEIIYVVLLAIVPEVQPVDYLLEVVFDAIFLLAPNVIQVRGSPFLNRCDAVCTRLFIDQLSVVFQAVQDSFEPNVKPSP